MRYPIKVFYSKEDQGYIATIPDLPGCSAFGETEDEALKEIHVASDLWLEVARKEGRPIPQATPAEGEASGKVLARIPRSLHRALGEKAKDEGISLNQYISYLLAKGIGRAA